MDRDDYARTQREAEEEAHLIEDWIASGLSPMDLWRKASALPEPQRPLTVAEAAAREACSTRTIHRRLKALAATDPPGAFLVGRQWRIWPSALDSLRTVPVPVDAPETARKPRKAKPKPSSTRWTV